jgi:nitrate reductase (NAD(P)H)
VRNHGAVPQIQWEEHRLEVNGLVARPASLSMAELLNLPSVDVTCTLTCVGESLHCVS